MTEKEWLEIENPKSMLAYCTGQTDRLVPGEPPLHKAHFPISDRKLRLFTAEGFFFRGGRRISDFGESSCSWRNWDRGEPDRIESKSYGSPINNALATVNIYVENGEQKRYADILRCIVGNPFRTVYRSDGAYPKSMDAIILDVGCLAPEAIAMANLIFEERDWKLMGLLADCLMDHGCPEVIKCHLHRKGKGAGHTGDGISEPTDWWECDRCGGSDEFPHPLIEHLKSTEDHYRGCWAIDLVTGRE
jgi:hypothetical protein